MATGYTAAVQDGTVTSFKTFAMSCARAFGALITMRDDPADAEIPEDLKVDSYYLERVRRDESRLVELEAMSDEAAAAKAAAAHKSSIDYRDEYRTRKFEEWKRYDSMLSKVEAWTPPSAEHQGMKEFMLSQLRESIKFDCGGNYMPTVQPLLSGAEWREQQIETARESLERSRESLAEEEERVRKQNQWLQQLRESLQAYREP